MKLWKMIEEKIDTLWILKNARRMFDMKDGKVFEYVVTWDADNGRKEMME